VRKQDIVTANFDDFRSLVRNNISSIVLGSVLPDLFHCKFFKFQGGVRFDTRGIE